MCTVPWLVLRQHRTPLSTTIRYLPGSVGAMLSQLGENRVRHAGEGRATHATNRDTAWLRQPHRRLHMPFWRQGRSVDHCARETRVQGICAPGASTPAQHSLISTCLHVSRPWCTSSSKLSPACPAARGVHASLKLRHCVCSTVPICWCGNAIALQVLRKDWLRIVPGVLSPAFWRAQLTTHPGYSWCASLTQLYATDSSTTSGMRCSCSFV